MGHEPVPEVVEALANVRVLASHRQMFQAMLEDAVAAACAAGVRRNDLAEALGVHRATFYRHFVSGRAGESGAGDVQ
jgi:hypothetical protein